MNISAILIITVIVVGLSVVPMILSGRGNLNKIKAKKTGDGQYGNADWASKQELKRNFEIIEYTPELWRKGINIPTIQGVIVGAEKHGNKIKAYIDTDDNHTMTVSAPGGGKTESILYPNLEYAAAVGMPCFVTDTKGNAFNKYAPIIEKYYHRKPFIIDLRYPFKSAPYNFLYLVNKYMDKYSVTNDLADKALAEAYAKSIGDTVIHMDGLKSAGQNQFFYTAGEGIIAGITLLVSELCPKPQRHIVSVFKIIRQLMEVDPDTVGKKNELPTLYLSKLYMLLPEGHTSKDLLAPTATQEFKTVASVMSTAMSQMLKFIDAEIEQIICFDDGFNIDDFINSRGVIFFVIDEKSNTKNFMINLIIRQSYNEALKAAEQYPDIKLPVRTVYWMDEFGTYNKIDNVEQMFSAGRSRNIIINPFLQSLSQLNKNYGKDVAETIKSSCQNLLFSFQAPLSDDAEVFSKKLGTKTVQSGSISYRSSYGNSSSQTSINMVKMPLMTADQIMELEKGQWIMKKTGMKAAEMRLYKATDWGIKFEDKPYEIKSKACRTVEYADSQSLMTAIKRKYSNFSPTETSTDKKSISDEYLS